MKNPKTPSTDPLKLMRWCEDHFPPIDLNAEYRHVVELCREVKRLRSELAKAANRDHWDINPKSK